MQKLFMPVVLLLLVALIAGCSDSPPDQPQPDQPPAAQPTAAVAGTLPAPVGNCQSRLTGKVVNTGNNQSPPNVTIEIASGNTKAKTVTDNNGLYGFFGLCAGEYTVSITPPNAKASQPGPKVSLDGAKQVKFDLSYK
ncbi:MAG: carboxypeptidase regulatory-like domain-containing protein [Chloroflexi bacterium]|nr:carboxypeptidase regulatory-like domain-containing protein [Chloroflexota bacterium]